MIDIQNLGFRYSRKGDALFSNLNLTLPTGTLCGLLGANGAGKSTLLKLMSGLSFPQHGRCTVLGHEPAQRLPAFLADIFLLPEEFQLPPLESATFVERFGGLYPRFDHAQFGRLLNEL